MKELDQLVENFFQPKRDTLTLESLLEMVEEEMCEMNNEVIEESTLLNEEAEKRFSMTIPIPKLTPSEAWGDPNSQSRQEINKVFSSISGGQNIKERINSVNKFLNVESAKRKRSPSAILNMMMITEALQATLNDFGDSSAGFVFEGFLAALLGGHQQADKVAGTLPIEDFVAFSEFGSSVPVSLKLLSGNTDIKGSYTNLVDFLMVRGAPAIKYLIAYKQKTGKDVVEKLNLLAFDITLENFVDFIVGTLSENLLSPKRGRMSDSNYIKTVKKLMQNYASDPSEENKAAAAKALLNTSGYNSNAGQIGKYLAGEEIGEPSEEEQAAIEKEKAAKSQAAYEKTKIAESSELITEASDRQWAASRTQIARLKDVINLESYGELDLSQGNIDALVNIYSDILGEEILKLLELTKNLTENINTYFSSDKRSKAQAANLQAQGQSEQVKGLLGDDPRFKK